VTACPLPSRLARRKNFLQHFPLPGHAFLANATDVVEHSELVADRFITFAEIVGQENVIAGTNCGLGGRVHPQIAWAKLRAVRDGAAIASKKLWS
jgi:5-methyltetrahydropteroyltriglutamate--homocysteine methyltransferase